MDQNTKMRHLLVEARKLIEDPNNWITENQACNSSGTPTEPEDPDAKKFCAWGAIKRATMGETYEFQTATRRYLTDFIPKESTVKTITWYNDAPKTKHKDIVELFERAIASL